MTSNSDGALGVETQTHQQTHQQTQLIHPPLHTLLVEMLTFDHIVVLIFTKNPLSFYEIRAVICSRSQDLPPNFKLGTYIIQGTSQHIKCVRTSQLFTG